MKKLLLTFVACFVAFASHAVDYYLVGGFNSWTLKQANCKFTEQPDGSYVLDYQGTLTSGFKINDGTWGATYNYGAQNGAKLTVGTPYTVWANSNSGNIETNDGSSIDNPHLVFTPSSNTLLITGQTQEAVTIYGIHSNWYDSTNWSTTNLTESDGKWVLSTREIPAGTFGIKVMDQATGAQLSWIAASGTATVTPNTPMSCKVDGSNFSNPAGNFEVVFDPVAMTISFNGTQTGEDAKPDYSSWYVNVTGPFNSWGDNGVNPVNGISTTPNLAIGTGGFKIKVWNGTDIYYVAENASIPTGQWVKMYEDAYDGSPTLIDGATENSVYTVQYNCETNEVYVTLTSGGSDTPTTPTIPQQWYLWTEADWSTAAATMALQSETANESGEYIYKVTGLTMNNPLSFKIFESDTDQESGMSYGCGSNGEFTSATTLQAFAGGGNFINRTDLTNISLTFYYNPTGNCWLQLEGTAVQTSLPEKLYLLGNVNGNNWSTSNGVEAIGEEGIYSWSNVTIDNGDAGNGFFNIATVLGADWDNGPNTGNRYGAAETNTPLTSGVAGNITLWAANVNAASCQSWMVPAGKYNIVADLNTMKITATLIEETVEPEPDQPGVEAGPFDVTFDFNSAANIHSYNSNIPLNPQEWPPQTTTGYKFVINDMPLTSNGVSFTTSGSSDASVYYLISSGAITYRPGSSNTITFTAPKGGSLDEIIIYGSTYVTATNVPTVTTGSCVYGDKSFIWTAPEDSEVKSVTFTTAKAYFITSIDVKGIVSDEETPAEPVSVYVVGAGDGLTWDLPGKEYNGEDGVVTFTVNNLTKFKASKINTTEWDGDNGYNSGCYGIGNNTFTSAVYSTSGQTFDMVPWGEDIELPWTGDYTITMDFTTMKMTAKTTTPQPTEAPAVYLRGDMNSWGTTDATKFTNTSWDGTSGEWTWTGSIIAGQTFKIADASWGAVNYTTGSTQTQATGEPINLLYNNGANSAMAADFNGTITLTISNYAGHVATAKFTPSATGPVYPESIYIIGNVNNLGWDPTNGVEMESTEEAIYSVTTHIGGELGTEYGYFSFAEKLGTNSSDWAGLGTRYGATSSDFVPSFADPNTIIVGENSFKVQEGDYTMTVDLKNKTLTIQEAITTYILSGPIFVDHADNKEMTLEDGVYTVTANVWPQTFNIKKMVNGIEATTYAAETDADAANQITRFGDFQGKANSTIDWVLSAVVAPNGGSELIFTFDPETMVLNIAPVPVPVELTLTGVSYQSGTISDDHIYIYTARDYGIVVVEGLEEGNELYYKVTENESANGVKALAEDADGFTLMTDNQILLPLGNGTLDYYVVSNGVKSSTTTYTYEVEYDFATGIFDIDMDGEGAEYFTIQGVKVANPEKGGIYIKVVNGKATKVVR